MSWVVALAGWGLAVALACSMRRRLSLVADAEHELRGAAAAIGLAAERMSRSGAYAALVGLQVDRMRAGLADLAAARGCRATPLEQPRLDSARLAQVLGNLGANAAEHGVGPVRIEIRNRNRPRELDDLAGRAGRGRGLAIATRAARELGGELQVEAHDGQTKATLDLPPSDGAPRAA